MKRNRGSLWIFETLYRLSAGAIFLWLANQGLRLALSRSGYSYLTPDNALQVLVHPWTLAALAFLAALGLMILMIEIGGLVTAYAGAASSVRVKPTDILMGGLRETAAALRRKDLGLFVTGLVTSVILHLSS